MSPVRTFLAVLLLGCQGSTLLAGEPSPVDVVQRFQLALELKDEILIRQCALPDPDLAVLWDGERPEVERLVGICLSLGEVKVQELGRDGEGTGETVRVQRTIGGRQEPPLNVQQTEDGWRLDARPFIQMALRRLGRSPAGSGAETWKGLFVLDKFLQNGPVLWAARLDVFRQVPEGKCFQIVAGETTRAVCTGVPNGPQPTLFGQPLRGLELGFQAGRLDEVVAVLYDAGRPGASLPPARVQAVLKELDRALRKLARSSGRFRQKRPDPENKARVVRAREWRMPGTLLRLEAVAARQAVTNPGTGKEVAGEVTVMIRVRATQRTETTRDRRRESSTERKVEQVLASFGTDISPGDEAFWEQSTLGFLGTLTAASYAHWTAEQEAEGVASYRCTYIRRPQREVRDSKPVLFVRNEPLSSSRLMLFGKPVVAMVASFRDDRLAAFRFDFWNKGDGAPGVGEDVGEDAVDEVLGRLRQAGLEFQRRAGSHGRISRVRDVRYTAECGPTVITFIVEKGEYYSLLLETSAEMADQDSEEKERVSGRELRTAAKGQVIRITTEKEAGEHPGVVRVGDVFVEVPMVDQGPKGYCAPATLTRVVQYYGNQTTMNEMAAMMDTEEGGGGTRLSDIRDSVRKVTRRLRMSFREEDAPDKGRLDSERRVDRWIRKAVVEYIDNGNPIFWTVPQHIRLIVGYNANTREVLYSDSWGRKGYDRVSYQDAASMTEAVWIIR